MKKGISHIAFLLLRILSAVFFVLILSVSPAFANDGDKPSGTEKDASKSLTHFSFRLVSSGNIRVDSALIILDKYDLTGAGIVIERVSVDEKNRLNLSAVPEGKYYAGIYTYGAQREYISVIITVKKSRKCKKGSCISIRVSDAEWYAPGRTPMPPEDPSRFLYVGK